MAKKTIPGLARPRWHYRAILTGFAIVAIGAAIESVYLLATGHLL